MAGFNDWVYFEPASVAGIDSANEVDALARENLARRTQEALRSRIDPGISLRDARRAQAVRVRSEGDRLVIDQDDQADVLDAASGMTKEEPDDTVASTVEQLFETSSGVPKAVVGSDGQERLAFRSISIESLFGAQRQTTQDQAIEQSVTENLRTNIVDAYEDAVSEVGRRHPR